MENKIAILIESLDKKIGILKQIQAANERQEQAFAKETPSLDEFDAAMEEKDALIDELTLLDDGFEALFAEIKKPLSENQAEYKEQIRRLQDQIRDITELSGSIQVKEARNKMLVEEYFRGSRKQMAKGRQQSRAAYDYYKSMNGAGVQESNLWDSKQ